MSESMNYIDFETALKRIGGNEVLYKKLLTIFLNDINIENLYTAIDNGDLTEVAATAHTIKGVAANLALTNLQNITTAIDIDAKAGLDCKSYITQLQEIYKKTVELINSYIQGNYYNE